MKLVVHDYCGHPFQVHLSRHLAMRGHDVTHIYFADDPGPKGRFDNRPDNPPSLRFIGITLGGPVKQTALLARRFNDVAYGRLAARIIRGITPDAVISGNTPTEAQGAILKVCKAQDIRFVYWLQDVFSVAVSKLVTKELGFVGKIAGWYYQRLDRRQFRDSDSIVVITEDFAPLARSWAGSHAKVSVIENWAAIDDISVGMKDNDWSRNHGFHDDFTFVYSGTLGRKHNPALLLRLAESFGTSESVAVVVVAQGVGVKQLHDAKAVQRFESLKLLPLQPAEDYTNVLATADVLVALIEADAGMFAVPSKVPSYMCAGRAILLAAPKENLAARIVVRAGAGIVVDPSDQAGFVAAARRLRDDPQLRAELGANGRAYAERMFDMQGITDKFESVLMGRPEDPQLEKSAFIVPTVEREAGTNDGAVRYQKSNAI
jgi:glycosyltransferase involved in cell wall biosynthesis